MSITAFDEMFYAAAHDAFSAAGMDAGNGVYTPPGVDAVAVPDVRILRDRIGMTMNGDHGQAIAPRTELEILLADVPSPVRGASVLFDGVTYLLEALVHENGSAARWIVEVAP